MVDDCIEYADKTLRPLTREACEKIGHIAWIEESDPVIALRRQHEAVRTPPFNAAIWANAGDATDSTMLDDLNILRDYYNLQAPRLSNHFNLSAGASEKDITKSLREFFEQLATDHRQIPGIKDLSRLLNVHANKRAMQILQAIPSLEYNFNLRASRSSTTKKSPVVHTDGLGYGNIRILENLGCAGTCLIENSFGERHILTENGYVRSDDQQGKTKYYPNKNAKMTYWQIPDNAVTLITNEYLPWQTILHAEPPTMPGQYRDTPRTIMMHDLYTLERS